MSTTLAPRLKHGTHFQPASSHALHLSLISLPDCNHLVRFPAMDKCSLSRGSSPSQQQAHSTQPSQSTPTMVSTRSSTRIKQSASPERPFTQASHESYTAKKDELPPSLPTDQRGVRHDVKKPLEQVRLAAFVNILLCVLLVCLAWYAYRTTIVAYDTFSSTGTYSTFSPTSLSLHTNPLWQFIQRQFHWGVQGHNGHPGEIHLDVERRVEELADALGVDPGDFARAIADAVRQLVPPASLSSLANEAKAKSGGRIMDMLLGQ